MLLFSKITSVFSGFVPFLLLFIKITSVLSGFPGFPMWSDSWAWVWSYADITKAQESYNIEKPRKPEKHTGYFAEKYFKSKEDKKDLKALYMMFKTMEPISNHIYKYKGVQYNVKNKVLRVLYFSNNNERLVVNPYPLDYLNNYFSIKIRLSQYISTFKK